MLQKESNRWWNAATLNEQLYLTGQSEIFDAAKLERNIKMMSLCMRKCGWDTTSIKRQLSFWGASDEEIEENVPISEEFERSIREQLKEQLLGDPDAGICILTPENPFPWVSHQHYEDGVITRRSMLEWGMPITLLLSVSAWLCRSRRGWKNQCNKDRSGKLLVAKMDAYCPAYLLSGLETSRWIIGRRPFWLPSVKPIII